MSFSRGPFTVVVGCFARHGSGYNTEDATIRSSVLAGSLKRHEDNVSD
jgi:hypothetical protein